MSATKQWQHVFDYLKTLNNHKEWLLFILPIPILGGQIWLSMWGPVNGLGLDVTLGYFLLPLVMIMVGRFFYKEYMSVLQWVAVSLTMAASSKLPVSLFGTLSYLETIFLFVLSITVLSPSLHEGGSLFMYGMIVIALLIMVATSA